MGCLVRSFGGVEEEDSCGCCGKKDDEGGEPLIEVVGNFR